MIYSAMGLSSTRKWDRLTPSRRLGHEPYAEDANQRRNGLDGQWNTPLGTVRIGVEKAHAHPARRRNPCVSTKTRLVLGRETNLDKVYPRVMKMP